jgi:predicted nucleic acid-binding protein
LIDHVFLDTSAFVKLYLSELGSVWLKNFITGKQIVASELVLFEATVAIRRRYIEGTIKLGQAYKTLAQLRIDLASYQLIPMMVNTLADELKNLIFALPSTDRIRTLDGIHLTSAVAALHFAAR